MQSVDVVHLIATLALAFLVIRTGQSLAEHYFPNSGAVNAGRFLFGGPS